MKLAFNTQNCTGWTLGRVVATGSRLGYGGVEFHSLGHDSRFFTPDPALTSPSKLHGLCARAGVVPVGVGSTISYDQMGGVPVVGRLDPNFDRSIEQTKQAIELCGQLGGAWVRVFASGPGDEQGWGTIKGVVRDRLSMALRTARNTGVRLMIENGGALAHADGLLRLGDDLPELDFDMAYHTLTGWKSGDDLVKVATMIGHRVAAVRITDIDDNGDRCALGDGRLPVEQIVRALAGDGFDGWLVYEPGPGAADLDAMLASGCERAHRWWEEGRKAAERAGHSLATA